MQKAGAFLSIRLGILLLAVVGLAALTSCSVERMNRDAVRGALRAAWRAYSVEPPLPDDLSNASDTRFDLEGRASIASLDSARAALPSSGAPEVRYLSATLGGLVASLRDRHEAQAGSRRMSRENAQAIAVGDLASMKATYDRGFDLLGAESAASGIATRKILKLAAWERRFLHETYLADSYVGMMLAMVDDQRAKGTPDSTLLHRPEIEAQIASWDPAVVAEIRTLK